MINRAEIEALAQRVAELWQTREAALPEAIRERDDRVRAAEAARARALQEAQERLEAKLKQVDDEEARVGGEIDARHRAQRSAVDQRSAGQHRTARAGRDDHVAKAKAELDEKVWLAETVYEGARPKAIAECERVHGLIREGLHELDTIEDELRVLLPVPMSAGAATEADTSPELDAFRAAIDDTRGQSERLRKHLPSSLVRSGTAYIAPPVLGVVAAGAAWFATGTAGWVPAAITGGATLVLTGGLAVWLRAMSRSFGNTVSVEAGAACAQARALALACSEDADRARDDQIEREKSRATADRRKAVEVYEGIAKDAAGVFHDRSVQIEDDRAARASAIDEAAEAERSKLDRRASDHRERARAEHAERSAAVVAAFEQERTAAETTLTECMRSAHEAWSQANADACALSERLMHDADRASPGWSASAEDGWDDAAWAGWTPPGGSPSLVPIGRTTLSLPSEPGVPDGAHDCVLPVPLDIPGGMSVLIEASPAHRDEGLGLLRCAMLRLLCGLPPGRVWFTLIDPVGLGQSFAGFSRLGDHDQRLISGRIWSEQRHIEQRLADLTEHMENVIQKYLRDEFDSIEAYNAVAGEIAEPYRVLVIADLPKGLNEESARRLASIVDSGARCGVHTLMLTDPSKAAPEGLSLDAVRERSMVIRASEHGLRPVDASLAPASITLDPPAPDALSAKLIEQVGVASLDAGRVEVPFGTLLPAADQRWTRSTRDELRVPVGRTGATRSQDLVLGHGTSQHALLAGKTGSGKSTLLHVLIAAAAEWHHPDELEMYLVDFKKGVEFKAYTDGSLPHVRAVAIESDREFGLSVLERLDGILVERGETFRKAGVQNLPQFRRERPGEPMPRVLLMIDEFQELFVEDDRVAQDASLLLDRLVRQGRAFGVHVLLGSQTLSGAYTLARSTMGQMGVRIALQCSETDSYLILSEDNGAARLLTRPGEAIYNDQGGLVEGNSPFQTAWLPDRERDELVRAVGERAQRTAAARPAPIVFEGNEPGDLSKNQALADAAASTPEAAPPTLRVWLGQPVSIKAPASGVLRRRTGANILAVGADEDAALGMLAAGVLGLGAQLPAEVGSFVLVDGLPEDDTRAWLLPAVADALPQRARHAGWREAEDAVRSVHEIVAERESGNVLDAEPVFLVLSGVHRLRALRKGEDDFSFSMDAGASLGADKMLEAIVRDGPGVGVFTIAWCDSSANLQRSMGRQTIGEFDQRVLMQMSAADSSALAESGSASRLGPHRALLLSLETGTEEKLRPYGVPARGTVEALAEAMRARR